jgi:hypothetical protein
MAVALSAAMNYRPTLATYSRDGQIILTTSFAGGAQATRKKPIKEKTNES